MRARPAVGLALLAVSAVALAGCSDGGPATTGPMPSASGPSASPDPTPDAPLRDVPASLAMEGCSQVHTFFPFPAAVFEGGLPQGFTLAPSFTAGEGFVDVFIQVGDCAAANVTLAGGAVSRLPGMAEMVVTLPVVPPQALRNATSLLDLVPLAGFFDQATAVQLYTQWGLEDSWDEGAFTFSPATDLGAARHDAVSVQVGAGTYFVDTVVQPDDAPFDAVYSLWVPDGEGAVRGRIVVETRGGQGVGLGEATFRFVGTEILPPALPGLAHRVEGASVHEWFAPVGPQA